MLTVLVDDEELVGPTYHSMWASVGFLQWSTDRVGAQIDCWTRVEIRGHIHWVPGAIVCCWGRRDLPGVLAELLEEVAGVRMWISRWLDKLARESEITTVEHFGWRVVETLAPGSPQAQHDQRERIVPIVLDADGTEGSLESAVEALH